MDRKQQQSKSEYGTLTAKYDANDDYSKGGGQKNTSTKPGQQGNKVLTSQNNIGD